MYWTTLEISAPRCALMCYPSSNITYCIACLLCIGVILLNKFNSIAVICVTKNRTGDYDFRACARARGFRGSTFSAGRICFAVCAERSRDKTCVF